MSYRKIINCNSCTRATEVSRNTSVATFICEQCSPRIKLTAAEKTQLRLIEETGGDELAIAFASSSFYSSRSKNIIKMGFDFTKPLVEQVHLLKDRLNHEYHINGDSGFVIQKRYEIPSSKTLNRLFKILNIPPRSLSEAGVVAVEKGRSDSHFKCTHQQWHETWDGHQVFLRSRNELRLAQRFDKEQVAYEVESKRIPYFDTQQQRNRIAVMDFYTPSTHTLIEVKSTYFYDEINIRDRAKAIHDAGYKFVLYLDDVWQEVGLPSNDLGKSV